MKPKKPKIKSLKEFKDFLAINCYDEKEYGDGNYDLLIYNWFISQIYAKKTKD